MMESGFPDFVSTFWTGIVAPAGTPVDIIRTLNSAINESLKSSEMQASLEKLGDKPTPGSPEEFAAFIAVEVQKWTGVARAANVTIE